MKEEHNTPHQENAGTSWQLYTYLAVIHTLALIGIITTFGSWVHSHNLTDALPIIPSFALLVSLVYGAQFVSWRHREVTISSGIAIYVVSLLIIPMPFAPLVAPLGLGTHRVRQALLHSTFDGKKFFFNLSHTYLTVLGTELIIGLLVPPIQLLQRSHSTEHVLVLLFLLVTVHILDHGKVLIVVSLSRRQPFRKTFENYTARAWLLEIGVAASGIIFALVWFYNPLALILCLGPGVIAQVAMRGLSAQHNATLLDRFTHQLQLVLDVSSNVTLEKESKDDVLEPLAAAALELTEATSVAIYVRTAHDQDHDHCFTRVTHLGHQEHDNTTMPPQLTETEVASLLENTAAHVITPLRLTPNELLGLLWIDGSKADPGDQHLAQTLSLLGRQAAMAIVNFELHEHVLAEATRDPLTNLFNRRAFLDAIEQEGLRRERTSTPLSILTLDLDGFKEINDTYGHQAGDALLCAVADILSTHTRATDRTARVGGDEFWVLLPETPHDIVYGVATRILNALQDLRVPGPQGPISISGSIGVATLPDDTPDLVTLMSTADIALYKAKESGKIGWPTRRRMSKSRSATQANDTAL